MSTRWRLLPFWTISGRDPTPQVCPGGVTGITRHRKNTPRVMSGSRCRWGWHVCTAVSLFIPQLLKGSSPSKPACLCILSRGGVRQCLRVLKERLGSLPAGAGLRGYADRSQAEWHFQSGKQLCERIWVSAAPPPWEQIRSAETVPASPRRCLRLRETAPAGSGCCRYIYKICFYQKQRLSLRISRHRS